MKKKYRAIAIPAGSRGQLHTLLFLQLSEFYVSGTLPNFVTNV